MVKKIIKVFVSILTAVLFIVALIILILGAQANKNNKPFKIFGYSYSVVPTESMVPEINPGEFVLAYNYDFYSLKIGDDIIYYSAKNDIYIVHRIIEISEDEEEITVKGINNSIEDSEKVTTNNYVGKVVKHGKIFNLGEIVINRRFFVFAIIIIMFTFLLISEGFNIYKLLRESKIKEEEQEFNKKLEKIREQIEKELSEEFKETYK